MRQKHWTCWVALVMALALGGPAAGAEKILKMSTTTSTQASGLLDILLPELQKDTGMQVKVFAKGTGAAIRDGMDGNVDVIFVHAKAGRKNSWPRATAQNGMRSCTTTLSSSDPRRIRQESKACPTRPPR